jgi:hypothetical protein
MKRIILVILATAFAVVLVACSKTENTSNNNANSNKTAGSAPSTSGPATTSNAPAAASTGDQIGIPECDDYIAKYESCVRSKVPEAMRAQMESTLKTARDNWKKAAENAQSRSTLAAACKQATDTAAASMKSFGCTF